MFSTSICVNKMDSAFVCQKYISLKQTNKHTHTHKHTNRVSYGTQEFIATFTFLTDDLNGLWNPEVQCHIYKYSPIIPICV